MLIKKASFFLPARLVLYFIFIVIAFSAGFSLSVTGGFVEATNTFVRVLLFSTWCAILSLLIGGLSFSEQVKNSLVDISIRAFAVLPVFVIGFSYTVNVDPKFEILSDEQLASGSLYFVIRNGLLSAIMSAVSIWLLRMIKSRRLSWRAESLSKLLELQSRIRPHFLFNTLNTISSLIHDHPDQAEQATVDLSDLLRTGLKEDATHALSDEIELIEGYLRIEKLRLGDRLNVDWQLGEGLPLDQQMPPLLLQPLVENAVIHGISRRADGGTLRIEGRRIRFGRIRFTVTNPLADTDSRPVEGNHSALENIRQRLALAYEERYGLKTRIEGGQFIAELTFPIT
ncbi:sensor histidine kinase [Wenzhouxiangella limi]|uniref:Signal transduction histidine kinase internal region domain-containing protein n=1 Tax=Wenzhouxiangella limi TaxID=2707351 RepID=A0A845URS3_9GAMM|nr:histidine kinase [Wenzhouxiangella limi]NDY94267.1 hypothetical protein [Wenzhouxiangella limi]